MKRNTEEQVAPYERNQGLWDLEYVKSTILFCTTFWKFGVSMFDFITILV